MNYNSAIIHLGGTHAFRCNLFPAVAASPHHTGKSISTAIVAAITDPEKMMIYKK